MARARRELPLLTVALRHEADVVLARQRARLVAELLGFSQVDQTRLATAVSEVARNAVTHAGGGRVEYHLANDAPPWLVISVHDAGPGLRDSLREAPAKLALGPGSGLPLTRRLVDAFEVESPPAGGTRVTVRKRLAPSVAPLSPAQLRVLNDELTRRPPSSPLEEIQLQHQELLGVLADLTSRQEALAAANSELEETNRGVMALYDEVTRELEETNRGVVALYAQLDDQAQRLREADTAKDRFISYLSHEFRTPLHAMGALSRLLLDRADGPLNEEQERQVQLIGVSADDLLKMVNDILDLAKIQAGKLEVVEQEMHVTDVFAPLRVLFRPLASEAGLELVFEEDDGLPPFVSDPQKLAQVLRNLIGNAIKFTYHGEVRVTARRDGEAHLAIAVRDTGVGIAADAQERIFREYEQVRPSPGQRGRGTGLGLPLSRRLASLLGGTLAVTSAPGEGSTFVLRLPLVDAASAAGVASPAADPSPEAASAPVPAPAVGGPLTALVVDDDGGMRYLIEREVARAGWEVVSADSAEAALEALERSAARLLVLDLGLPGMSGFELLSRLHSEGTAPDLTVVVCTGTDLDPQQRSLLESSTEAVVSKRERGFEERVGHIAAEVARRIAPHGDQEAER